MSKPPQPKKPGQKRQPPGNIPPVKPMGDLSGSEEQELQKLLDAAANHHSVLTRIQFRTLKGDESDLHPEAVKDRHAAVKALREHVKGITNPQVLQKIIDAAEAASQAEGEMPGMPAGALTKAGAAVNLCETYLKPRLRDLRQ